MLRSGKWCRFWAISIYYRPKEGDTERIVELRHSLEMAAPLKGNIWVLGNLNYPKFSWDHDHNAFNAARLSLPL